MSTRSRVAWIALLLLGGALALILWSLARLPDVGQWVAAVPRQTSYTRASDPDRVLDQWVALDSVSPLLACAVVKAEDRMFARHGAMDWGETIRALREAPSSGLRGASGITQQLAKNLYLDSARTLRRKFTEVFIARRMEQTLGKRRILELYLNTARMGPDVWGVGEASRAYFKKDPRSVTAFEAAILASLLPAPTAPWTRENRVRARRTQYRVLHQLRVSGLISESAFAADTLRLREFSESMGRDRSLLDALRAANDTMAKPSGSVTTKPLASDLAPPLCGLDAELAAARREQTGG